MDYAATKCKAHPYAETVGGACWYCAWARKLRATKCRTKMVGPTSYMRRASGDQVDAEDARAKMFRLLDR